MIPSPTPEYLQRKDDAQFAADFAEYIRRKEDARFEEAFADLER